MANTKIRLIIFFAAKDGEALYSQQKQDQELTVAQIMNSLLPKWSEVAQSCPTICDPIDCSLPGSCVHGIFQAIVLEWIAISFSRGSSRPRDWTRVSHSVDRCFTIWATKEVLIAKHRFKLKKAGITTRSLRYDLNQISDDYTVEVANRFKGLDLIAWRTMDRGLWYCIGDRDQDHPQEKAMQKGKMVVWWGLTNSYEKKRSKRQRRKGKIYPFKCTVPKNTKER